MNTHTFKSHLVEVCQEDNLKTITFRCFVKVMNGKGNMDLYSA